MTMVKTIRLEDQTHARLDKIRVKDESYDGTINRILDEWERKNFRTPI